MYFVSALVNINEPTTLADLRHEIYISNEYKFNYTSQSLTNFIKVFANPNYYLPKGIADGEIKHVKDILEGYEYLIFLNATILDSLVIRFYFQREYLQVLLSQKDIDELNKIHNELMGGIKQAVVFKRNNVPASLEDRGHDIVSYLLLQFVTGDIGELVVKCINENIALRDGDNIIGGLYNML